MKQPDYIQGILTNDYSTLRALYRNVFPMVSKMIRDRGGSEADAREVFQESLQIVVLQARRPGFNLTSKFSTYLYGIAFNRWRSHRKKKSYSEVSLPEDAAFIADDPPEGADDGMIERRMLLYRAMERLGEDCRKLLLLFFGEESMKKIADEMGFAGENYAARRKHTCKERLITLIKGFPEYNELRIR